MRRGRMRRWLCFWLLLCVGCLMLGCGGAAPVPRALLGALPACDASDGAFFDSTAACWDREYLDSATLAAFFGVGEQELPAVSESALWLSARPDRVAEAAVFLCPDYDTAQRVAQLCFGRISLLRRLHGEDGVPGLTDPVVSLRGRYVIYLVLPDNRAAEGQIGRCF